MTKIKNTKKGMAKKTLSISLAVAMLATSNVPVWAAEFSDGTDAAAVQTEEFVATPVEETATETPVVRATGDAWEVTLTNMPSSVEWNTSTQEKVTVDLKAVGETATPVTSLKYVWKNADGLAIDEAANFKGTKEEIAVPNAKEYVGKSYTLFIYDEAGDWSYNSPAVTVTKQDITNKVKFNITGSTAYTGKEVKPTVAIANDGGTGLNLADFNVDYTGNPDLINKGSNVTVTLTVKNADYYTGKVEQPFVIGEKTATAADFELSYINNSYEYTGNMIYPATTDIRVLDKNSGNSVDGAVETVTGNGKAVGSNYTATAKVDMSKFTNYAANSNVTASVAGNYSITARNLNNCTATVTAKQSTGKKAVVNPSDITIKDAAGNNLTLGNDIQVTVPDEAINSGSYTITITPKTGNKNVSGSVTANLVIYANNIEDVIKLDNTADAEVKRAETYTGSQITKDTSKIIGHIQDKTTGKAFDQNDYRVEFGTNVNAGNGVVRIVGLRSYEGSVAEYTFTINKANKKDAKISDVVFQEGAKPEDYKPEITITATGGNVNGKPVTLTLEEGKDFTVKYSFKNNTNAVGNGNLIATITYSDLAEKNYKNLPATLNANIVYPSLTNASIKMEKTSYEYTGAAIIPEYKVFDGTTELKEGKDYVVKQTIGGKNVGTATLVIAGAPGSKYNPNATATATFEVTPASAEKVEVKVNTKYIYDGTQKKPSASDINITLNGNDVESQFDITSYGENVNAGKEAGTFVVTPKKDNKNFTTGTSKNVVFEIQQKVLTGGSLKVYDERGIEINLAGKEFDYDGTPKTFAKVVYTPSDKLVTADDYEIKYINNTVGNASNQATIAVIAKGNFKTNETIQDVENDTKVENVVKTPQLSFTIKSKLYFTEKEVTVTDAEYAGPGVISKPTIVVKDGGKVLEEGKDYTVTLNVNAALEPSSKKYTWEVTGKGVYANQTGNKNHAQGTWKVVKKDVANLDVKVELNEAGEAVLTVMNGNYKVDSSNFEVKLSDDKKKATVSATKGNKYYVNSKEVTVGGEAAEIEAPFISEVKVVGNKATVVLSGESDGAVGYDYVISTENDYKNGRLPNGINKNQLTTQTTYQYLDQGIYYAYCHAWKRVDGKKVFSEWSNIMPFSVSSITPSKPVITDVTTSKNTVTVTYTKSANATGYDLVLGNDMMKVNGEMRPVNYGKLVKKVYSGNTVKATFTKVPKGTYYVGLHAYNRTSEDGKKVFSPWSNAKKITVK